MTNKQDIPPAWTAAAGDVLKHIDPEAIISQDYINQRNTVAAIMLQAAQRRDAQLSSDPDIPISEKIQRRFERVRKVKGTTQKAGSLYLRILSAVLLPTAYAVVLVLGLLIAPALVAIVILDDDFLP